MTNATNNPPAITYNPLTGDPMYKVPNNETIPSGMMYLALHEDGSVSYSAAPPSGVSVEVNEGWIVYYSEELLPILNLSDPDTSKTLVDAEGNMWHYAWRNRKGLWYSIVAFNQALFASNLGQVDYNYGPLRYYIDD